MEQYSALERVDAGRILSQAEQLLASGDVGHFENLVHALEAQRQQYLEVERQSASPEMEQLAATARGLGESTVNGADNQSSSHPSRREDE